MIGQHNIIADRRFFVFVSSYEHRDFRLLTLIYPDALAGSARPTCLPLQSRRRERLRRGWRRPRLHPTLAGRVEAVE